MASMLVADTRVKEDFYLTVVPPTPVVISGAAQGKRLRVLAG